MSVVNSLFQRCTRFTFSFGECLWTGYAFFVPYWSSLNNHFGLYPYPSFSKESLQLKKNLTAYHRRRSPHNV